MTDYIRQFGGLLLLGSVIGGAILRLAVAWYAAMTEPTKTKEEPIVEPKIDESARPDSPYAPSIAATLKPPKPKRGSGFTHQIRFHRVYFTAMVTIILGTATSAGFITALHAIFQPRTELQLSSIEVHSLFGSIVLLVFVIPLIFKWMLKIPKYSNALLIVLMCIFLTIIFGIIAAIFFPVLAFLAQLAPHIGH